MRILLPLSGLISVVAGGDPSEQLFDSDLDLDLVELDHLLDEDFVLPIVTGGAEEFTVEQAAIDQEEPDKGEETPYDLLQIPQAIEGSQSTSSSSFSSMGYDYEDEFLDDMLKALADYDFSPPAEDNQFEQQVVPKLAEAENGRTCPPNKYRSLISRALARRDPHSTRLSAGELDAIIKEVVSLVVLFTWSLRERFELFCKIVNEVEGGFFRAPMEFETFVNKASKVREGLKGMAQNVQGTLKFDNGVIELLKQAVLINPESTNEQVIDELSARAGRSSVTLDEEILKGISTYLDYIRWTLMDESFEADVVSFSGALRRKRPRCDEGTLPEIIHRDEERQGNETSREIRQQPVQKRYERNHEIFEETLKMRNIESSLKVLHKLYAEKLHQKHPDISPMSQSTFVRKAKDHIENEERRIL